MFLTQEYSTAFISVDGDPATEIGSEEVVQRNVAVFQEIEQVLKDYPEYPYQAAFSIDELRSKLVAHVLRHLPNRYSGMGNARKATKEPKFSFRSKAERVRLDALIRGSILHILRENADWLSRHLQQLDDSVAAHRNPSDCNDKYELNLLSVNNSDECGYLHYIALAL
jgi:hypothetical protein